MWTDTIPSPTELRGPFGIFHNGDTPNAPWAVHDAEGRICAQCPDEARAQMLCTILNETAERVAALEAERDELQAECARWRRGLLRNRTPADGAADDALTADNARLEAEVTRLRTSLEGWKKLYTECDTTRDALIEQYAETAYQNALRWAAGEIRTFARDCDIDEREIRRLAGRIEAGPEPVKETTDETD